MYYIDYFEVRNLWNEKDLKIDFSNGCNVIIGNNGVGKTTIINLISGILRVNKQVLNKIIFSSAILQLSHKGQTIKVIVTKQKESDGSWCVFKIGSNTFKVAVSDDYYFDEYSEAVDRMNKIVNAKWIGLKRHEKEVDNEMFMLGSGDSEKEYFTNLMSEFSKYKLKIETLINQENMKFQKKIMEMLIYDDNLDGFDNMIKPIIMKNNLKEEEEIIKTPFILWVST